MTIDTQKIIRLMQPLCMVELVKGNAEVKPRSGAYFDVPYLVGWADGEYSVIYSDWYREEDVQTADGTYDSTLGGGSFAYWNVIGQPTGHLGLNFSSFYVDGKYVQYRSDLFYEDLNPAHESTYNGGIPYTVGAMNIRRYHIMKRTITINTPAYIYLAKVDGMPYHFATQANAQKWIDKTLEREEKTRPKQGDARAKKIASLSAYKEKINKKWQAAKLRAFQNDDLKKKVLDMLVREYVEAGDRLLRI